jgi:glycerol-3-phosphate dehydrogenase (NAD(P)+)
MAPQPAALEGSPSQQHVAVLGAGAWGTALACAATRHAATLLWARDATLADAINTQHLNARYLPAIKLPDSLACTASLTQALAHAQSGRAPGLLILGVPLAGLRALCEQLARQLAQQTPRLAGILYTCKGLEADSGQLPSEVARSALAAVNDIATGVLSGPSFALEVARGLPVALAVASQSARLRDAAIQALHGDNIRIYASDDVLGVEVGGALKNIVAIACGVGDGLGLGTNARAALITRGLAEITRFGEALGAQAATFAGLTGLGDLVLTATGELSRNRQVGLAIGQGQTLDALLASGLTAEGARCARAVRARACKLNIDMPITEAVCKVLFEGIKPLDAVTSLLSRIATTE